MVDPQTCAYLMKVRLKKKIIRPEAFVFSHSLAAFEIVKKSPFSFVSIDRKVDHDLPTVIKIVVRYSRDKLAVINCYDRDMCNLWPQLMCQFSSHIFFFPPHQFYQSINTGSGTFPHNLLSEPGINFLCLDTMC